MWIPEGEGYAANQAAELRALGSLPPGTLQVIDFEDSLDRLAIETIDKLGGGWSQNAMDDDLAVVAGAAFPRAVLRSYSSWSRSSDVGHLWNATAHCYVGGMLRRAFGRDGVDTVNFEHFEYSQDPRHAFDLPDRYTQCQAGIAGFAVTPGLSGREFYGYDVPGREPNSQRQWIALVKGVRDLARVILGCPRGKLIPWVTSYRADQQVTGNPGSLYALANTPFLS